MAFPKANDLMRLYKDRDGSFILVYVDQVGPGGYDAVVNVLYGPRPSLGSAVIPWQRISDWRKGPKRVGWDVLPEEWRRAFADWLGDEKPEDIPGFWPIGYTRDDRLAVTRKDQQS